MFEAGTRRNSDVKGLSHTAHEKQALESKRAKTKYMIREGRKRK